MCVPQLRKHVLPTLYPALLEEANGGLGRIAYGAWCAQLHKHVDSLFDEHAQLELGNTVMLEAEAASRNQGASPPEEVSAAGRAAGKAAVAHRRAQTGRPQARLPCS